MSKIINVEGPSATSDSDSEIDLRATINAVWRGKWLILLLMFFGFAIGWYESSRVAIPEFRATAQLSLTGRAESIVNIDSIVSGVSADESSKNTELEVIRSRALIEKLVDEMNLTEDPEFNPALRSPRPVSVFDLPDLAIDGVKSVLRGIAPWIGIKDPAPRDISPTNLKRDVISRVRSKIRAFSQERGNYVFFISATSWSSSKSAEMANTLARIYAEDQVRVKVDATERAADWLAERAGELGLELEQQQLKLSELRSSNALVSVEGLSAVNAQAIELRQRLQLAENQALRADQRLETILAAVGQSADVRAEAADDGQLDALATSITNGDSAAIVRFDRRFDQIKLQTQAEKERAAALVAELQISLDTLGEQYESQSNDLLSLQQLERETEATRVLYEAFLTRLRETTVQLGIQEPDSRLLSEATPGSLVAPRRSVFMAVGLLFGFALGLVVVLLRELRSETFRTSEDLERRTGKSVLGQIPLIVGGQRTDVVNYLKTHPTSAAAEAVRDLRTSILLSDMDKEPRTIMVTSSLPAEGKTTVSIALTDSITGLGKKVLLIEGDIRRRTLNSYFPIKEGAKGLLSVLSGEVTVEEAVQRPEGVAHDVLMGERSSVNAADVFSSVRFTDLLETLKETYDLIVIDTPPVLIVPDARVIAQHVDAAVYVVNWDSTTPAQVEEGLRQFKSVNVNITGLVLSKINPKTMKRYGYEGKYGSYGAYAKGYYDV